MNDDLLCYCVIDFFNQHRNYTTFCAGQYYKFFYETGDKTIWVIYDENGDSSHQGYRFCEGSYNSSYFSYFNFYDYFEKVDRLFKLKQLQKVNK